ncbi:MAG: ABC transporter ATP-binding protein [Candidatus Heimdallarchaeota archaeon]|nr:ABC transporter ATP-binding protein [Candidatus Heimdallarchaeota archaeon]
MTLAIETIELSKTYNGEVEALRELSMQVKTGESIGFLGPNGAGKTTTIQILLNLIKPTSGEVYLFDEPVIGQERFVLNKIGALVGMPGYFDKLSPDEFLNYTARTFKMNKKESTIRIKEVLELVGLADVRFKKVGTFSTGMKRRLGIGQILIHDPELIILDEPTSGLDPKGVREVRDLIKEINKQGKTIFMTTHNLAEVDEISERVLFLKKGQKIADEQISDMRKRLGSKQIELKFSRELEEADLDAISSISGVKSVFKGDNYFIEYTGEILETQSILSSLVAKDLPVYSYAPKTLTLEDIYLKIFGSTQEVTN